MVSLQNWLRSVGVSKCHSHGVDVVNTGNAYKKSLIDSAGLLESKTAIEIIHNC